MARDLYDLADLVEDYSDCLDKFAPNPEPYKRHIPAFRKALDPSNWDSNWEDTRKEITEEGLTSIELFADILDAHAPEGEVSVSDINDLIAAANDILAQIASSDLSKTEKAILADLAQSLYDALTQYNFRGLKGLRAEMFRVISRLESVYAQLPKSSPLTTVVLNFIQRYQQVTSAVVNTGTLGAPILTQMLTLIAPK